MAQECYYIHVVGAQIVFGYHDIDNLNRQLLDNTNLQSSQKYSTNDETKELDAFNKFVVTKKTCRHQLGIHRW